MRILNHNSIPLINTYDPKNPSIRFLSSKPFGVEYLDKFEIDIWYCLFSCKHSFQIYKIKDLIPADILVKIKNREVYVAVDNALEPFLDSIDAIYQFLVVEEGIPSSQVIFVTNMYDAAEYSKNVAATFNVPEIKVFWFRNFEADAQECVRVIFKNNLPKTLESKEYPKKFLNLNRRWRLHRPFLTTLLFDRKLLDKGFVSFGPCDEDDTWNKRWPELQYYFRNNQELLNLFQRAEGVKKLAPLYLDTMDLKTNRAVPELTTNKFYSDSYFSVVSETTYFTKEWYFKARFLSEKTYKAIAMKHPFILVSVPNSLDILRKQGYKTFEGIVDERYDLEQDDGKRMLMVVDEIERLSNLTPAELEQFLIQAREICKFNFDNLMAKTDFIDQI